MAKSKYKISVITPLHNEAPEIFSRAYKSMRAQTIGYKNIQWIIVLHNCDQPTIKYVTRLVKNQTNVCLKILNNEVHTPSSPKNYAMNFATADYIAYLDADDWYMPDCLKVAVDHAYREKATIVAFRREHSFQEAGLNPLVELLDWNQLEDKIIITKKHRDEKKLYAGQFHFLTSKIFKRNFLLAHKIDFDETMPLAEDFIYAIEAFANAPKIVYLPRFIGYHYFIRSSSLAQKSLGADETFLWYANTIDKAIAVHKKYKVHSDSEQGLLLWISFRILATPNLSVQTREKISKILNKYFVYFKLRPQDKFHNFEAYHQHYWIPQIVLKNPRDPIGAYYKQNVFDGIVNLWTIIKSNTKTDFGQKYNFAKMNTPKDFQKTVPLMTRTHLDETLKLQTHIGEFGILINGKPDNYMRSKSGELFMNSSAQNEVFTSALNQICAGKPTFFARIKNSEVDRSSNDATPIKTLEDVLFDNAFFYAYKNEDKNYILDFSYAKKMKGLKQIFAIDSKSLIEAFENFEAQNKSLFKKAGRKPIAKYLWPNLETVIATQKSSNSTLKAKLKKYFGDVHISNSLYFSELGIIGKQSAEKPNFYEIFDDKNVYELKNCKTNKICNFSNCKTGLKYYLVVTNNAGLYRYVSNHKIQIKQKSKLQILYSIKS